MDGHRHNAGGNRRRRRKAKGETKRQGEPVLIVARRPDSPLLSKLSKRNIAASAHPKKKRGQRIKGGVVHGTGVQESANAPIDAAPVDESSIDVERQGTEPSDPAVSATAEAKPRRVARIAQTRSVELGESETRRQRLLERLVVIEGRSAISGLVDELLSEAPIPEEQRYQVQLLEHLDERHALHAIAVLTRILSSEAPIKRPILDQRLRRLEEEADDMGLREGARALRRQLRAAYPLRPARAS